MHLGARAEEKITEDVGQWPNVETGGVLIGRYSETAQGFYITDVLIAPPDSVRSADEFILGTKGLKTPSGHANEENQRLSVLPGQLGTVTSFLQAHREPTKQRPELSPWHRSPPQSYSSTPPLAIVRLSRLKSQPEDSETTTDYLIFRQRTIQTLTDTNHVLPFLGKASLGRCHIAGGSASGRHWRDWEKENADVASRFSGQMRSSKHVIISTVNLNNIRRY